MKKKTQPKIRKSVRIDERATDMVSQIALDEKINLMNLRAEQTGKLSKQLRRALRDGRAGAVDLITKLD
ncbi:MAG: hypothetical protein KJP04_06210 [Arenicella sp.]|nr:hypothetical protein [Arenicella sp.]